MIFTMVFSIECTNEVNSERRYLSRYLVCIYQTVASCDILGSLQDFLIFAPVDGSLVRPFTEEEAINCGFWRQGSMDYPYFGAPREGDRIHGGIDIYTTGGHASDGGGMVVRAIRNGTVLQVIHHFYQRSSTGEITQAVLIDHGYFVACYCEIRGNPVELGSSLILSEGESVDAGEVIGYVSGTKQLHFELYLPGTQQRSSWYGSRRPDGLLDPTEFILKMYTQVIVL